MEPIPPELAPEAGPAMLAFARLCAVIVTLGIIKTLHGFTRATFGGFSIAGVHIPGLSSILPSPVNAVVHWMDSEFSQVEAGLDAQIGYWFARQPALIRQLELTAWGDAVTVFHLAQWAVHKVGESSFVGVATRQDKSIKSANAKAAGAAAAAAVAKKIAGANHPPAILYHPGGIAAELPGVTPRDTATLRERVKAVEGWLSNVWRDIRSHPLGLATGAFVGAVTFALGRLGLGWLRCSNVKKIGSQLCGMPTGLFESLLALVTDFLVLTNICTVIPWLESAFSEVAGPLIGTLTKAGAGLCGGPTDLPTEMTVPQLYVPKTADASLHLG